MRGKVAMYLLGISVLTGFFSPTAGADDTTQAVNAILEGALVVDVRSESEFSEGHVKGAMLIPHTDITARRTELGGDINRTIVVYCRSGGRSEKAKQALQDLGFTKVINGGGIEELSEALWEARRLRGES